MILNFIFNFEVSILQSDFVIHKNMTFCQALGNQCKNCLPWLLVKASWRRSKIFKTRRTLVKVYIIDIYMIKWIFRCKKNFVHLPVVHDHGIETSCGVLGPEVTTVIGCDFCDLLGVQVEASSNTCCRVHLQILFKQNFIRNNKIDVIFIWSCDWQIITECTVALYRVNSRSKTISLSL